MGTPAVRITDPTVHGGMLVVGYPTVLIGNLPASRIGDNHVCPMVTVVVPHVGGPLVTGAWTTITGMSPQSRATDFLICIGPPDVQLPGCPTVLVGMVGGAGLGSILMGLGMGLANFLGGYPRAVVDPKTGQVVTQYNSQITIEGSAQYQATVVGDLNRFLATNTGKRWAKRFQATGHRITIQPVPAAKNQDNGYTDSADGHGLATKNADGTIARGTGTDSTIGFNPSRTVQYTAEDGNTYTRQPYEVAGHEMIHALNGAEGNDRGNMPDTYPNGDDQEEAQTIGVHGYDSNDVSERSLSEELRGPGAARPDHDSITQSTYQDSSGNWHDDDQKGTDTIIPAPVGGAPNH